MILCKQSLKPSKKNAWKHAEFVNKFSKLKGKKRQIVMGTISQPFKENFNIATYLVAYHLQSKRENRSIQHWKKLFFKQLWIQYIEFI